MKIRIAVVVDDIGNWHVAKTISHARRRLGEAKPGRTVVTAQFIEVDVPLPPEPQVVQGEVIS